MRVLVLVEHEDNTVAETSRETLTLARGLGSEVEAVVVGAMGPDVVEQLRPLGVTRVHHVEHDLLTDYAPEGWAAALAQLVEARSAGAVLAASTDRGNEVLAHVGARLGVPMAASCTVVEPGDTWALTRLRWGGILFEDARLSATVKLATVAPHAVRAEATEAAGHVPVEKFAPQLTAEHVRVRVVGRTTRDEGVTLATAPVVVSGGRGVGSADGFGMLEELAGLLGGAVGCSRVATNNGWRSHADQVGQTGTKISPSLYIACGISGATQHWVGCMHAKRILAINTDADAPMVQRAHYAVLGNLHEVLPAVIAEVRRRTAG